jgi:hypothetical protein
MVDQRISISCNVALGEPNRETLTFNKCTYKVVLRESSNFWDKPKWASLLGWNRELDLSSRPDFVALLKKGRRPPIPSAGSGIRLIGPIAREICLAVSPNRLRTGHIVNSPCRLAR